MGFAARAALKLRKNLVGLEGERDWGGGKGRETGEEERRTFVADKFRSNLFQFKH